MARLVEGCFHLLKAAIASCLVLMVVLVFGNVVLRYAFMGITTSEELSRFFFVWMTFLGAIVALREHGHLGSDPPRRTNGARNLPQRPGAAVARLKGKYLEKHDYDPNLAHPERAKPQPAGQAGPHIYGPETLDDVEEQCRQEAARHGLKVDARQSNHEGVLIDWIHGGRETAAGIIFNPGAYTHTSVAIHDALKAFPGPIIEVHLSNIHQRESFRHRSYVSLVAKGVIAGLGVHGYILAIDAMARWLAPGDDRQE